MATLDELIRRFSGEAEPEQQGMFPAPAPVPGQTGEMQEIVPAEGTGISISIPVDRQAPEGERRLGTGGPEAVQDDLAPVSREPDAMQPQPDQPQAPTQPTDVDSLIERFSAPLEITPQDLEHPGPVRNALRAFNRGVADALGMPAEVWNEIASLVGQGQWDPSDRKAQAAIREIFDSVGARTDAFDTFSKLMGDAGFQTMVAVGGLGALIPRAAQAVGPGVTQNILNDINRMLAQAPATFSLSEFGANIGAKIAELSVDKTNPWTGHGVLPVFAGGLAGAIGGGLVAGTAQRGVHAAQGVASRVAERFRPAPDQHALRGQADYTMVPQFAQRQLDFDQARIETQIQDVLNSVRRSSDSRTAQRDLHAGLLRARETSQNIVSRFWDKVPLKQRVPMTQMHKEVRDVAAEMSARHQLSPDDIPADFIERILQAGLPVRGPDGRMSPNPGPTIEQLRVLKADIDRARRAAAEGSRSREPNAELARNLSQLEAIVDTNILRSLPRDVSLQQAVAASKKHHEIFSRGPIAELFDRTRRGQFRVQPREAGDFILNDIERIEGVLQIAPNIRQLRDPRDRRRIAASAGERQQLEGLQGQMEQTFRDMFREMAPDPQTATKWIRQNEAALRASARVHAEFQDVFTRIMSGQQELKELQSSALSRVAQMDADKAIRFMMTQGPQQMRQLVNDLRRTGDTDALAGLKNGVLDYVFQTATTARQGIGAQSFYARITDPRVVRTLQEVLPEGDMQRLNRIADIARMLERGDIRQYSIFKSPVVILGRLVGAKFGRMIGPGTLQGPSIMSEASRRLMERMFNSHDPGELLRLAVVDPRWERLLLSREPLRPSDVQAMLKKARPIMSAFETGRALSEGAEAEQ